MREQRLAQVKISQSINQSTQQIHINKYPASKYATNDVRQLPASHVLHCVLACTYIAA